MDIIKTFEYRGRVLQLTEYDPGAPTKPVRTAAPGAGKFEIESVSLPAANVSAGEAIRLSARVTGKNIAYIYTELLLYDKALNQAYGPLVREHVQAERTRTTRGATRPDWDSPLDLSITLHPGLRLLTDGADFTFGFFLPEGYDDPDSRLDGLYTSADGKTSRRARLSVDSSGAAKSMTAFKEQRGRSMPAALTLRPGDQFAPFVQILTRSGDEWQGRTCLSTPLTFRGETFHWVEEPLMPGDYLAGLLVEDLDGKLARKYASLTVGT